MYLVIRTDSCQSLIGTVSQDVMATYKLTEETVSIPYRYGITTVFSMIIALLFL